MKVHVDNAHVKDIVLFLFLILGITCVNQSNGQKSHNHKPNIEKNILKKQSIQNDNRRQRAITFDKNLHSWLKRNGGIPYKTQPYYQQSHGIAKRMVPTAKMRLKVLYLFNENLETNRLRFLLSYRTIPPTGRK